MARPQPNPIREAAPGARPHARSRLSQLWQGPLLLVSLGLFAYAAYLFIDPKPGPTVGERIDVAERLVRQDRTDAAFERLNDLVRAGGATDAERGRTHLLLAEAIERGQALAGVDIPANHLRIVEQTRYATGKGVKPTVDSLRRLADSYAALGQVESAAENYRRAIDLADGPPPSDPTVKRDRGPALPIQRRLIDLLLAHDQPTLAEGELKGYLDSAGLSNPERAWALGRRAQLLADAGRFTDARLLLDEALRLAVDPVDQGVVHYSLGYCAYKLGDAEDAERHLRVARSQLGVRHPVDADACRLLGDLLRERAQPQEAISFYQTVLTTFPGSPAEPAARLGRGVCRVMTGDDEGGMADLRQLAADGAAGNLGEPLRPDAVAALQTAGRLLRDKGDFGPALEAMALERELLPSGDAPDGLPPATFLARLAALYERRAEQVDQDAKTLSAGADAADRVRLDQQARDLRTKAADAYVALAKRSAGGDDDAHAEALWKGIDLYDRAGDSAGAVAALELYVAERPSDPLVPDALLRLGDARAAAGDADAAITAYEKNLADHPQAIAAVKSAVPLARAYASKGPAYDDRAEATLLAVVQDNPLLTPESGEFRQAVLELGELYHRTGRYDSAVGRLDEFAQRYPDDPRLGRVRFLTADAQRRAAGAIDEQLAKLAPSDPPAAAKVDTTAKPAISMTTANGAKPAAATVPPVDPAVGREAAKLVAEQQQRLAEAKGQFDAAVAFYAANPPTADLDKRYEKLAYFYRADCLYDLRRYDEAIALYDAAVFRYQDDPRALAGYVQIVNANVALGRTEAAKTANERAKWLLGRIPPESFADGSGVGLTRGDWQEWLDWSGKAGL